MRHQAGITLIELVVAMALFALVAVMGLQALNGMLRARDRLEALSAGTAELSAALSLMRHDLGAALPAVFHTPEGLPVSAVEVSAPGPRLALSLGGQATISGPDHAAFQRIEWSFDGAAGRLVRQVWPSLQPASRGQLSPPVPVLTGVTGLGVRLFAEGLGWTDWADLPADSLRTDLPDAIEVTLTTGRHGAIRLVEVYR